MNLFTWIFLALLIGGALLEYWLLWRQVRAVGGHRHQVPAAFAGRISLVQHQKAADYTMAHIRVERITILFNTILLLTWTLGGALEGLQNLWQQTAWPELWQGTGLLISILGISTLLELPISIWRTFGIEERFGFNRNSIRQFLLDQLLQLGLMLFISIPLVASILWLMDRAGSLWWLEAWLVWMLFTLSFTWAYPTLIAPLFNKFTPLDNQQLKARLETLLQRCGFHSRGMFVMDGSKRSAHGNAYFSGFGRSKRIVFFDTLLDGLTEDEIEAVLAHELGHFKRRHILKGMLTMAFISLLGLALLGWLREQTWFFDGLGVSVQTDAMALSLFLLVLPVFTTFFTPLFSALSRRHEFEADEYAAAQTSAEGLISGLVKMYRDNASTLTPDHLYSAFHHSHPPATVRIAHLSSKIKP
jgi:STE24 endopeptidase